MIGNAMMAELKIGEGDSVRITRMKEGLFDIWRK